ncbi:MAG: ATP-binding protein [Candidatus Binataceae bacterium]|nr:ATP-binding protein [Candidatus Binataceae bacterium]
MEISTVATSIEHPSDTGEARRRARAVASQFQFGGEVAARLALIVTEAATNIVKHAKRGEILINHVADEQVIEVLALDQGPGMASVDQCLRDGYSTGGTPGGGLGAIKRSCGQFEIYSGPGHGTALLARLQPEPPLGSKPAVFTAGGVCVALASEQVCGDGCAIEIHDRRCQVLVSDGLGHGVAAHEASDAAINSFKQHSALSPAGRLQRIHDALRHTRGAAAAIAEINLDQALVCFSGVGNIAGTIVTAADNRSMISHYGTLGHQVRKFQEFTYPWSEQGLMVLASDGLGSRWNLSAYPTLARHHPSLIAGVLYRDFKRGRDDVSIVVTKQGS